MIKTMNLKFYQTFIPLLVIILISNQSLYADSIMSPRAQFESGIAIHEIECRQNFVLVLKASVWSPACVKPSSQGTLIKIGWAITEAEQNKKLNLSKMTTEEIFYSFTEVTKTSGIDFEHKSGDYFTNIGGGVAVLDYNQDGWDDIFLPNGVGENALYQNNGDMTFTDVAKDVGLDDPTGIANGACSSDFDNDNDTDLFVTGYGTSKLFENNGGVFTDLTLEAGVLDPDSTFRSTGCAWGDYDQDGFLDLIITRWVVQSEQEPFAWKTRDFTKETRQLDLFHNNDGEKFSNVTFLLENVDESPSNVNGAGFQPRFVDYDNDGDLDLYIVNDFGLDHQPSVLWRNDGSSQYGNWKFTDVSEPANVDVEIFAMGLAVGDYDNDEDMDFFITNMGDNVLLANDGENSFIDKAHAAGVSAGMLDSPEITKEMLESIIEDGGYFSAEEDEFELDESMFEHLKMSMTMQIGWGAIFFDYDNDGFLDLYIVRGFMTDTLPFEQKQPNLLFRNLGDGTFDDVSSTSGVDDSGYGRGVAYGDFNNDGCLDIFLANVDQYGKLFVNNCNYENNYLIIKAIGTESNKDAIGARIKVVTDSGTQIREVASGGSHMSQNMLPVHFGLGKSTEISLIQITWPSGNVQELTDIPANQKITVTESVFN